MNSEVRVLKVMSHFLLMGLIALFSVNVAFAELINLNKADVETLQTLKGIGPVKAQAIIDYRRKQPFKSIDDLKNVPGIGEETINKNRKSLSLSKGATRTSSKKTIDNAQTKKAGGESKSSMKDKKLSADKAKDTAKKKVSKTKSSEKKASKKENMGKASQKKTKSVKEKGSSEKSKSKDKKSGSKKKSKTDKDEKKK